MTRPGQGPEDTPAQWRHFADFVRRALHAAADQVEPQADGLEPIRAKIPAGDVRDEPTLVPWRLGRTQGPSSGGTSLN
jgi:hypothetical protein